MTTLRRRKIGSTDLVVGELGLGTASFGNLYEARTDSEIAEAAATALAGGIRYFDTAPFYGYGLAECRLGDVLGVVPDCLVSTKVGRVLDPDPSLPDRHECDGFENPLPFRPRFDYTYEGVMRSHEASLRRLGRERIDILFVHDIGERTHGGKARHYWNQLFEEGGYEALSEIKSGGAISAIGLGVNETAACIEAMKHGRWDVFLLAGRYTLLEQGALDDFFPALAEHGATAILGGIYNSGILASGTVAADAPRFDYAPADRRIIARVARIEEVCRRFEVDLATAALHFALAHPLASAVIAGPATASETRALLTAYGSAIPPDFWRELVRQGLLRDAAPLPGRNG